jgi:uncharacterized protein (DUF58 family)
VRAQPRVHRLDIGAGEVRRVVTELRPSRRGDQHAATVTTRSIGPLGLAGRQRSTPVSGQVRVLPPFLSRKHLPSRLAKLRELEGMLPVLIRGQGTEFDSLREYVAGDDVRSIDWRATARRADVVVRTWRPERDRRVVVVLDTGRTAAGRVGVDPTGGDPGGWPRLDWSMDAALLLAALASRAGDQVDLLAHDRVMRAGVFGASRTQLLAQLVDAMSPLQPALLESDAAAMVATIGRRVRRRALVVLLTDLNAAALDEGLLPVLPRLTAGHQVILAAVADPRVDRLAQGRSDAAAVYDAAAAERARNDRPAVASAASPWRGGCRRPARGTGPRLGRPLPGDEGHRAAVSRYQAHGSASTVARRHAPHHPGYMADAIIRTAGERERIAIERERIAKERERAAAERENLAHERERTAAEREVLSERVERRAHHLEVRTRIADRRDALADERDRIADERDALADERERIADEREQGADERQQGADTERTARSLQQQHEAASREHAKVEREQAEVEREQATSTRKLAKQEDQRERG